MTLTIDGRSYAHGALALAVPDCDEIRALIANVPVGELHLAAFDEALHPRAHKGESGGGRFIKKLLHQLAAGDTFEHPTLGRMERLPQGGAKRADGRLTVRSLTTGKRVHMHPGREVRAFPPTPKGYAPKAWLHELDTSPPKLPKSKKVARVKRSTGATAFEKDLKARVGTPEAYHAAVARMAGKTVTVLDKGGSQRRGILERNPHGGPSAPPYMLTTATHVLERRTIGREGSGWQTHSHGLPGDLAAEQAKLDQTVVRGTSLERNKDRIGKPAYETRIRQLGHWPPGEMPKFNIEHTRQESFHPDEAQGIRVDGGEGAANPATLNKSFIGKSPSARPHKPGHVYRPAEGYFPGSENEPHTLVKIDHSLAYRGPYGGSGRREVIATGPRREMERLRAEHAGSTIEPPQLTTVRFVSPIDGQVVERQLTPGELEKFNRLVEKPAEARVADAKRAFSRGQAAKESIRAVPLSQVEPGTPYFNQHAEAMGVRGVEKKGAIEVHEPPNSYGRTLKARLRQGEEVVHVKAGAQQTLTPGPQVGHVHITYNGDGHGLMDNAGQIHASGLSNEEALRRLREMNAAYDNPAVAASGPADEATLHQAFNDWNSGRAYIDNAGNYRLRAGTTGSSRTHAPWSKAIKATFPDNAAFHQAASSYEGPAIRSAAGGYPVADAGRLRGVEQAVHSQSQKEAEREAKYLREYQRRFGSASSRAINRSLAPAGRR